MLCCLTSKTRGCAAEWQRRGIASFLQKATFLCVKISQNFPLSCVTFTYLITFKCAGQKQHKQTGKMAIQSKLSRVHVWHSGSTAVQSTQIWGANRTTRLATFSRQRAVHWTAMRGAPRDLQGRTNQAPRRDWSERPWRTGRWHTRRRKKKKKVQIYSLIIAVGNYRSSTHTHILAHKTNKHTLWDSFRNVRVLLVSSLPLRTLSLRYFFRFNNGTVTSTRASSCLIWHKILSHFIWHQQCPCFVIAVCFQMTLLQQLSDTNECFCAPERKLAISHMKEPKLVSMIVFFNSLLKQLLTYWWG